MPATKKPLAVSKYSPKKIKVKLVKVYSHPAFPGERFTSKTTLVNELKLNGG